MPQLAGDIRRIITERVVQRQRQIGLVVFGGLRAILGLMASENVELARSIFAAWERGDFSSAEWAHPEIEFVMVDRPDGGSWTGSAQMGVGWYDFLSAWDDLRCEEEETRELDAERLLILFRLSGRGKTSGLDAGEMRARAASLFHVRGGKVTRLVLYPDRERAFADLGLTPEGGSPDS